MVAMLICLSSGTLTVCYESHGPLIQFVDLSFIIAVIFNSCVSCVSGDVQLPMDWIKGHLTGKPHDLNGKIDGFPPETNLVSE